MLQRASDARMPCIKLRRCSESESKASMAMWTAWIALLLLQAVSGKSLTDGTPDISKGAHQCEYQGKTYSSGEDLPTRKLCLACKCTPDFVEPNDRACNIIDCPPDNRIELGCIPVYNDTECCPVSYNCDNNKASQCNKRYFKHYQVKGCTPVYEEGSECPKRFNCPKETKEDNTTCHFRGHVYQVGDEIDTGNPCEICSCRQGWEGIGLHCINKECFTGLERHINDTCHLVYEEGKCCPHGIKCDTDEEKQKTEKTCEYGGRTYLLGEKIYPKEDDCLSCRCNENWTGIHGNGCRIHDCNFERDIKYLNQGCVPVYHEAACCPIEYFCGSNGEGFHNKSVAMLNAQDQDSGNFCEFQGNRYEVGHVLDYQHPTNCVTCTCLTPPEFTCVHRSCPSPPPGCDRSYVPGVCCPVFDCGHNLTG